MSLEIINYLVNQIHCLVTLELVEGNQEHECVVVGVYGDPELTHWSEV